LLQNAHSISLLKITLGVCQESLIFCVGNLFTYIALSIPESRKTPTSLIFLDVKTFRLRSLSLGQDSPVADDS